MTTKASPGKAAGNKKKPEQPKPEQPTKKEAAAAATPTKVIGDRLEAAVKEYPPARNRSSDLVPLTRDFETLRRQFRALRQAVQAYPPAIVQQDRARMEVCVCVCIECC